MEVVTHEAGHAFAAYMNRDRIPYSYVWPSMEACEVHSMSMEFFAWPWADGFFGQDARKFRYSHLAGALTFIPYGTMVDHFQHIVYEKPDMTRRSAMPSGNGWPPSTSVDASGRRDPVLRCG